jgi:hypothetical protein
MVGLKSVMTPTVALYIRVLDEGGLVWESDKPYTSIDRALADAEQAIDEWLYPN